MLDLERHVLGIAVGTGAVELLQEVFPDLIPGQGALLVFHPTDSRVLHHLHVEANQFHGHVRDRCQGAQAADHREGRIDPVLEAGGQPPFRTGSVVEPGSPVAQVGAPATATEVRPLFEALADGVPTVKQFAQPKGVPDRSGHPGDGDAGSFRPGVQGQDERLDFPSLSVLEPDGEGVEANHHRLLALEQNACPGRGGRHEWPPTLVQDKNTSVTACRLDLGLCLGP